MQPPFPSLRSAPDSISSDLAENLRRAATGPHLHWHGPLELAARTPRIAVIGTRQPTPETSAAMEALAGVLAEAGTIIVSGAARGTDMAAHRGALSHGAPTIACVPAGLATFDVPIWRKEFLPHYGTERLLLLSPFTETQPTTKQTPIVRNRLIAALAEAVVIGEAGLQSGTYHCARFALELGVPVFFLRLPSVGDAALAFVHRRLENRGAQGFTLDDVFGERLPRAIADAARAHREACRAANEAQLRLFDETPPAN